MNQSQAHKPTFPQKCRNCLKRAGKELKLGFLYFLRTAFKGMYVCLGLALLAATAHIICYQSVAFADFMTEKVCAAVRFLLAKLTGWIPFSLAELIIILLPLILTLLILCTIHLARHFDKKVYCRYVSFLLSVISLFYTLFVFTLAPGYRGSTLDVKMGLTRQAVSKEELLDTADILLKGAEAQLDQVYFRYRDFSVMPYSLDEMNDKLNDAYAIAAQKYSFISPLHSSVKYVMLSHPMSYTHITGVYSYYTGEANLNIQFPDYSLPYTAAHELAHQRGIAREDEANFVAFLVCMESDDPYIHYSAYTNMLEYVMSALYSASPEAYSEFYRTIDSRIVGEFYAYSAFFDQYRENKAAEVSESVNNSYLVSQGQTAGTRSYGLVVDLAVAYFKE